MCENLIRMRIKLEYLRKFDQRLTEMINSKEYEQKEDKKSIDRLHKEVNKIGSSVEQAITLLGESGTEQLGASIEEVSMQEDIDLDWMLSSTALAKYEVTVALRLAMDIFRRTEAKRRLCPYEGPPCQQGSGHGVEGDTNRRKKPKI